MGPLRRILGLILLLGGVGVQACDVPGDGTSLRRALLRVKYLPETELWELQARKTTAVQYILSLAEPLEHRGRCYWPIEARSADRLWRRFYATPRGEHLLVEIDAGVLISLEDWRARQKR